MPKAVTSAAQATLLRWLADELDAGNAHVNLSIELESEIYDEPGSWTTPHKMPVKRMRKLGSTWAITARTLKAPTIEGT